MIDADLRSDLRAALDPAALFEAAFGLAPLAWQVGFLHETRPVALCKGRQIGASLAAAALAIHTTVYRPGANAIIVSPSLKQSTEITTRARAGLRRLGVRLVQDAASMLALPNGSRIVSLPGTARSARGYSADLLVLDECAYLEEDTITAARALVAATRGRTIAQSTPAEPRGFFHGLITSGDPSWVCLTVRSDSVPTISAAFLAAERRAMSPGAYAMEYEATFGEPGATLFSVERINALILSGSPS
jgi:hypothetical protein